MMKNIDKSKKVLKSQKSIKSNKSIKRNQGENCNKSLSISRIKKQKSTYKNQPKQCPQHCNKHNFQIKTIPDSKMHTKGIIAPLSLNFCSTTAGSGLPSVGYGLSKQPQIPLFLNGDDIQRYSTYLQQSRRQYDNAVALALKQYELDQNEEMFRPIPKASQCQICKVKIDDYEIHIRNPTHLVALKSSTGQKMIEQQISNIAKYQHQKKRQEILLMQIKQVSQMYHNSKKAVKTMLKRMKPSKLT